MSRLIRPTISKCNAIAVLALSATLLIAFRLWSFSYFWTDDFGNIFWIQSESAVRMLGYLLNPASTFYRPFGELFYWILYHSFGLTPLPYHLVAWSTHVLNTCLLFALLRKLLQSPFAAIAGAIPFAFRVNFADMYWSFGTIFELLACFLMLLGTHLYIRSRRTVLNILLLSLVYMLAIKSKEMAITLPAVWLLYETCLRSDIWRRPGRAMLGLALPMVAAVWFTHLKVGVMRDTDPSSPYFIDMSVETLYRGFGQYVNWLTGIEAPPWLWCFLALCFLFFLMWQQSRVGIFFFGYTLLTFAPVIFLPNHRWPYFWYIPFFGVSGLVGLGARRMLAWLRGRVPLPRLIAINAMALVLWAGVDSSLEYYRSRQTRAYEDSLATAIHSYVSGLRALGQPEPDATLYFTEMPPHFHEQVLNASVQVILVRPDIHARFVTEFPSDARWKLRFSAGTLHRISSE